MTDPLGFSPRSVPCKVRYVSLSAPSVSFAFADLDRPDLVGLLSELGLNATVLLNTHRGAFLTTVDTAVTFLPCHWVGGKQHGTESCC